MHQIIGVIGSSGALQAKDQRALASLKIVAIVGIGNTRIVMWKASITSLTAESNEAGKPAKLGSFALPLHCLSGCGTLDPGSTGCTK